MTDLFCSFSDIRSISTNYYQLRLFLPSKNSPNSLVYPYNSRITNRKALHLTFLSQQSSPEIDVVSTHEHSDGSLIFRFGDPSEVVENVKMEEQKEMIGTDSKEEFQVLKVLDGDLEREVVDESHSDVQSSQSISVVDKEMVSGEKLLARLEKIEKSNLADVAVLDNASEVEDSIAREDEGLKKKIAYVRLQSVSLEPEDNVSGPGSETVVTKDMFLDSEDQIVEHEIRNETIEDAKESGLNELLSLSPELQLDTSFLDEAESENLAVPVVSESEGDTDDVLVADDIVKDGRKSDVIELMSQSPLLDAESKLDEVETRNKGVKEFQEDKSDFGEMSSLSPQLQPPFGLVNKDPYFKNVSTDSEDQVVEAEIVNDLKKLMPASPQLQPGVSLLEEANSDNLGDPVVSASEGDITMLDEVFKGGNGGDIIESTSVSSQLELDLKFDEVEANNKIVEDFQEDEINVNDSSASNLIEFTSAPQGETESVLHEEMGNDTVEDSRDDDGTESPTMTNEISRDLTMETERTTGDEEMQINKFLEASANEVTGMESTMYSAEIFMAGFVLSSGAALLPHPSKALTGGEDAYFVTGETWLGVADGVSQWSLEGTKPGVYAQELIRNCDKLVTDRIITRPLELLHLGVTGTHSIGSSTVLIAQVDGQALNVANVGDSGFIILRHGTVYRRSSPMLHLFHFPLQIERDADPSHLAEFYQVDLEEDDVIITATDGLLDNLYALEISSIVLKLLAADTNLKEIAEALARRAQEVGRSSSSRSPFADSAQAAGYAGYTGGKLDDVAVVVSVVKRRSN